MQHPPPTAPILLGTPGHPYSQGANGLLHPPPTAPTPEGTLWQRSIPPPQHLSPQGPHSTLHPPDSTHPLGDTLACSIHPLGDPLACSTPQAQHPSPQGPPGHSIPQPHRSFTSPPGVIPMGQPRDQQMPPPQPGSEGQQQFGEDQGTLFLPRNGRGRRHVSDGGQGEGCCWIQAGTGVKQPAGTPCPPALSCQGGVAPQKPSKGPALVSPSTQHRF